MGWGILYGPAWCRVIVCCCGVGSDRAAGVSDGVHAASLRGACLTCLPRCAYLADLGSFCQRCIEIICEMADGALGKCPKCRKAVQVANGQVVVAAALRRGKCRMCNQGNKEIVEAGKCDACLFGSRYVLGYECDRCHRTQRIPHPMWRHCASPDGFSTATWACHQGCGDYTHWRVIPGDVPRVPAQDRPESWGTDEWLRAVRERRQSEASSPRRGGGRRHPRESDGCLLM